MTYKTFLTTAATIIALTTCGMSAQAADDNHNGGAGWDPEGPQHHQHEHQSGTRIDGAPQNVEPYYAYKGTCVEDPDGEALYILREAPPE